MTTTTKTETAAERRDELQRRLDAIEQRTNEINARVAEIEQEDAAARLAHTKGELEQEEFESTVIDLDGEGRLLFQERNGLDRDAVAVRSVLGEVSTQADADALEAAREQAAPLREAERKLWWKAGRELVKLEAIYDELVANFHELQAFRLSVPPLARGDLPRTALPFPVAFRDFAIFAIELAANPHLRDLYRSRSDIRADAVPDLTERFREVNVPAGVQGATCRPGPLMNDV